MDHSQRSTSATRQSASAVPLGLIIAALGLTACSPADETTWTAVVPRVWDEAALATLEVPAPQPEYTPEHVDADYYYAIEPREVYRSYPVYHPDHEPEGYWEWLLEQEPEVVFDSAKLETKADWIAAGELVFHEGNTYNVVEADDLSRNADILEATGMPVAADGTMPLMRYFIRERGKIEMGTDSCAGCHTRVLDDGTVIVGAQGNLPLGALVENDFRQEAAMGLRDPATGRPLRRDNPPGSEADGPPPARLSRADPPWLEPDPSWPLESIEPDTLYEVAASQIPGVQARKRASNLYPTRVPDLIGIENRLYLDATGLVQHRSIGDLMRYAALNQLLDDVSSFGGFIPRTIDGVHRPEPTHPRMSRYSDEQLYALALYLYSLEPPKNPNPFDAAAERGQAVFEAQDCGRCHSPPLYTNNMLTPADGFEIPDEHFDTYRIRDTYVGTDAGLTLRTRRGTGYYKVPSLKGVWYRGPFFHDGALATLEDVFDPGRLSDDFVPTGFIPAGVETKSVPGHRYGLGLNDDDRSDLIAFLKTL
jgi:hypothetical protein